MAAERQSALVVEPMALEDVDAVMEIEDQGFATPWPREIFVEELDREFAHVDLLRERGGARRVLAFVNYWLVHDEVHVLNVATHLDARRQGHGSRLLEHVVGVARRRRCRYLTLEVRRSNTAAAALYRKHGFRAAGVRRRYYADNDEDAIVMLLDLEPADGAGGQRTPPGPSQR